MAEVPHITVQVTPQIDAEALSAQVREAAAQVLEAVAASLRASNAPAEPAPTFPEVIATVEDAALPWPEGTTARDKDGDNWTYKNGEWTWNVTEDSFFDGPRAYLPFTVLRLGDA